MLGQRLHLPLSLRRCHSPDLPPPSYTLQANHTSAQYPFLDAPVNSRNRTMFYATLARLLFSDDTQARFNGFVAPLQQVRHTGRPCLLGWGRAEAATTAWGEEGSALGRRTRVQAGPAARSPLHAWGAQHRAHSHLAARLPPQVLVNVGAACSSAPTPAALRAVLPAATLVGLFRDLRGIAAATNSRRTYGLLFDWLYPAHFPAIMRCLEAYAGVC